MQQNITEWECQDSLDVAQCLENAARLRNHYKVNGGIDPDEKLLERCSRLPVIHICDYYAPSIEFSADEANPCRIDSIAALNEHQSLTKGSRRREVQVGLHKYIRAHIGGVDPITEHAGTPIGVFLKPCQNSDVKMANVSLRDVRSNCEFPFSKSVKELDATKTAELLLSPKDAPEFVARDIGRKHNDRICEYCGIAVSKEKPPKLLQKKGSWNWRLVYHQLNTIPAEQIIAVLYPSTVTLSPKGGLPIPSSVNDPFLKNLRTALGKRRVFVYQWTNDAPESFIENATALSHFHFSKKYLPPTLEVALTFTKRRMSHKTEVALKHVN